MTLILPHSRASKNPRVIQGVIEVLGRGAVCGGMFEVRRVAHLCS